MSKKMQNNKIEKIMKETLDNKNIEVNTMPISLLGNVDESLISAAPKTQEIVKNDVEYTISPDGKYKIPKPKKHADTLIKKQTRIPFFERPGYEIYWAVDREPNSIPNAIAQGWEFVDPNTTGCENAREPVYAGTRPDGSAYFHYALCMPKERHQQLAAMRHKAIDDKENEILQRPSDESKGIYATEQMKFGTVHAPRISG